MIFNALKVFGLSGIRQEGLNTNLVRWLGLLAGITMPLFRLLYPVGAYDPMWLRWAMGSFFILVILSTFVSKFAIRNLHHFLNLSLFMISSWILWLCFENHFSPEYVLNYFMVVFLCNVIFNRLPVLLIYNFLNLTAAGICIILAPISSFSPGLFLGFLGLIKIVSLGTQGGKILLSQHLEKNQKSLKIIAEAAFESSRDAILAVDQEGIILGFNQVFADMWDLDRQDLKKEGRKISQEEASHLIANMVEWKAYVKETWAHPEMETQFEIKRIDGKVLESYSKPFLEDGQVLGRIWYFLDVTESRQREAELRASRTRLEKQKEAFVQLVAGNDLNSGDLKAAFSAITKVGVETLEVDLGRIWLLDEEGEYSECWNEYSRHEVAENPDRRISIAENQIYFEAIASERVLLVDDMDRVSGRRGLMKGHASAECLALIEAPVRLGGKMVGLLVLEKFDTRSWSLEESHFVASLSDLVALSLEAAETARAEESLENSLTLLRAIFEVSGIGILVTDSKFKVKTHNEFYIKMWGMTSEMIESFEPRQLLEFTQDQLKEDKRTKENVLKFMSSPDQDDSALLEFKDGRYIERITRGLNVGEEEMGRVWFYRDITDRTLANMALVQRNFELDSFVYRVSHDLAAPLASLVGLLDILTHQVKDDETLRYLGMMYTSIFKLRTFIQNLTDFSKNERLDLAQEEVDFQGLIAETFEDLAHIDHAERVKTEIKVEQEIPFISDSQRISIVLSNLISNTLKYQNLDREDAFVQVAVVVKEDWTEIKIRDNGLGIERPHLEKIYDLFFRASNQAFGSGLGLYIARNAILKLKGEINCESEIGKGTTFTVRLPSLAD